MTQLVPTPDAVVGEPPPPDPVRLAPTGPLRAVINVGNPVLAHRVGDSAAGVSVDLAVELAARLGVPLELTVVGKALHSVETVRSRAADVGFFAVDPGRSEGIAFTAPYVLIEGGYLVREDSPVRTVDDVDHDGVVVAVGGGSAYDLFLARTLRRVTFDRVFDADAVVERLVSGAADVAAGIRSALASAATEHPGLRLVPGRFMVIEQAMGVRSDAGEDVARWVADFVEARKAEGFLAESLARHGAVGGVVAPPAASRRR